MRRIVGALVVAVLIGGYVMADEFSGRITKIEDGSITVSKFDFKEKKSTDKTFKVSKDVKVTRAVKDKDAVTLTLDELKTAIKVSGGVQCTIVHDGDNGTEIKVGGGGFTRPGKDKKGKDKKDDK